MLRADYANNGTRGNYLLLGIEGVAGGKTDGSANARILDRPRLETGAERGVSEPFLRWVIRER
jgi:hypothetical protein